MIRAAIFVLTVSLTQATLLLAYPLTPGSFLLAGSLYLAGSLLALYLVLHPRSGWLVDNRSQVVCNGRACVALTFDDGPDPVTTPRVLDVLRCLANRLLLRAADGGAGAGLRLSLVISYPSLEAGHSVWDQVREVDRLLKDCEGMARHQFLGVGVGARHSAIGALEECRFPDELGHVFPPGVPLRPVAPIAEIGPGGEIDGAFSLGNQLQGVKVFVGGQRLPGEVRHPDEVSVFLVDDRGLEQGRREQHLQGEISHQ